MKVHLLALLLIACAVLSAPLVSAEIIEEKDGYVVMTVPDSSVQYRMSSLASSTITQGEYQYYTNAVSLGSTSFHSNLYWGNTANSLSLTIAAPDAQLGPYYDSSDGSIDGRINIVIVRSGGLTPGTWWSSVYGYSVSGSQSYTYTAYAT